MEREHTACSSLLRLMGAVLADAEPMPARLVSGCISPWPSLLAYPHATTAYLIYRVKGGELKLHNTSDETRAHHV